MNGTLSKVNLDEQSDSASRPIAVHPDGERDHRYWWAKFTELVSKTSRHPGRCSFSDESVHVLHGGVFSIRDCAQKAIEAAYEEGLIRTAHDYEDQSRHSIASFDRHVRSKICARYNRKIAQHSIISSGCTLFAVILYLILSGREMASAGLKILILISLMITLISATTIVFAVIGKKNYSGTGKVIREEAEPNIPQ